MADRTVTIQVPRYPNNKQFIGMFSDPEYKNSISTELTYSYVPIANVPKDVYIRYSPLPIKLTFEYLFTSKVTYIATGSFADITIPYTLENISKYINFPTDDTESLSIKIDRIYPQGATSDTEDLKTIKIQEGEDGNILTVSLPYTFNSVTPNTKIRILLVENPPTSTSTSTSTSYPYILNAFSNEDTVIDLGINGTIMTQMPLKKDTPNKLDLTGLLQYRPE